MEHDFWVFVKYHCHWPVWASFIVYFIVRFDKTNNKVSLIKTNFEIQILDNRLTKEHDNVMDIIFTRVYIFE